MTLLEYIQAGAFIAGLSVLVVAILYAFVDKAKGGYPQLRVNVKEPPKPVQSQEGK